MLKQSIAVLLLVPALGWADCGFVSDSKEMVIVVGKSSNKCFTSESFRENFRANLVASVKTMEENSPETKARPARRPPVPRPSMKELPVQQAVLYYGQNPKR